MDPCVILSLLLPHRARSPPPLRAPLPLLLRAPPPRCYALRRRCSAPAAAPLPAAAPRPAAAAPRPPPLLRSAAAAPRPAAAATRPAGARLRSERVGAASACGRSARAILRVAGGPAKMKDGGEILEDRMHDGVGYKICWNLVFGGFLFIFTDRRPYTTSVGDALTRLLWVVGGRNH